MLKCLTGDCQRDNRLFYIIFEFIYNIKVEFVYCNQQTNGESHIIVYMFEEHHRGKKFADGQLPARDSDGISDKFARHTFPHIAFVSAVIVSRVFLKSLRSVYGTRRSTNCLITSTLFRRLIQIVGVKPPRNSTN